MKKIMVAGLSALPAFAALAEDSVGEGTQIVNAANTALSNLITSAIPVVLTLLGTGLAIWGGFKVIKLVMKAFGFGTGR